jgi:septal ring factor EnvC (AmiA/AmiB activator)
MQGPVKFVCFGFILTIFLCSVDSLSSAENKVKSLEKSLAESEKKQALLTQESAQLKDDLKRSKKDRYDWKSVFRGRKLHLFA